ncbi:MAG: isoprenylcysteine carboxylmethyltransferase family protein [Devosia sp.]
MPVATPTQNAAVIRSLVSLIVVLAVMGVLLFWPAGTLNWPLGWCFASAFVVAILISLAVLWRLNPDIFVARAKVQAGTKAWDYIFLVLIIGGFIGLMPVAGFDFRFGWSAMPDWVIGLGYALFVVSFAGQVWPQAVNRHFEPGVRIQEDRGQVVIDTGPYAIVRHPGYISGSLLAASIPLMLGSWWALIATAVVIVALAIRTLFEEQTLRAELPGYTAYTQQVKYRWVPGVW